MSSDSRGPMSSGRATLLAALAAAALAAFACAAPVALASWPAQADSLVILHTNDIHAHLFPYENARRERLGGAAARAALIGRERAGAARTLLIDAGDVFQGTPYYNFFRGVPDYRSMSLMRYDAGALGNHDLDDGPAWWLRARREAEFPILSANVFVAAESAWAAGLAPAPASWRKGARWIGDSRVPDAAALRLLTEPYVLRNVDGIEVAMFGVAPKDLVRIVSRSRNAGVAVSDPIAVAARLVPELRAKADVVIAISHLGADEDRILASRVPGIDLIVGGHTHTMLRKPVVAPNAKNRNGYQGTAIVQAGRWGEVLGRVSLRLGPEGIAGVTGSLLPVRADEGEDDRVRAALQAFQDSIDTKMAEPVFRTRGVVSAAGLSDGETPLGDFVADVIRETSGADVAIMNSGGIRAPLPAGVVTLGDIYSALPFDNKIVTVRMEGWQVRQLLDFIARRLGKGGFAQVSGVRFVIRRDRATNIRVGNEVLESNRVYRVATIDFLYEGGDGYTEFERAGPAEPTEVFTRDAAVEFLRRHPDYEFKKRDRIHWEGALPMRGFGR